METKSNYSNVKRIFICPGCKESLMLGRRNSRLYLVAGKEESKDTKPEPPFYSVIWNSFIRFINTFVYGMGILAIFGIVWVLIISEYFPDIKLF